MWLIPAFISSLGIALQSVYLKKNTIHFNEYIVTWSIIAISAVLYLPILFYVGIPHLTPFFWIAVFARLLIDTPGLIFYVKALKIAPLSLAVPMVSLTPILLIGVSFVINHLVPTPLGLLGVVVTACGIYFLHFDQDTKHILSPFFAVRNNRGLQYMLVFVFSQAIVASLQRLAIDNSNVYFYTSFFQLFWALLFIPLVYFVNPKEFRSIFNFKAIKKLFPVGGLDALQVFAFNIGLTLALPVYIYSIQNTSILFAALFGFLFFKEKVKNHLVPILIILTGITLLSFAQK